MTGWGKAVLTNSSGAAVYTETIPWSGTTIGSATFPHPITVANGDTLTVDVTSTSGLGTVTSITMPVTVTSSTTITATGIKIYPTVFSPSGFKYGDMVKTKLHGDGMIVGKVREFWDWMVLVRSGDVIGFNEDELELLPA